MSSETAAGVSPSYLSKRRSVRYKLDAPLRVILHKEDASLLRDGRGTEVSETGMCVMVGMELNVGAEIEIEFTLPFTGEPIRVAGVVRNRDGYRYGCEFIPDGIGEREEVARLRKVLRTLAGERSA